MISTATPTRRRLRGELAAACGPVLPGSPTDCVALAVFPTAAYLRLGEAHDAVLPLLRPDALQLPGGVRVDATAPDLRRLITPGDVGTVDRDRVGIGGLEIRLSGTWQPARVRPAPPAGSTDVDLLRADPDLRAEARELAGQLVAGETRALDRLVGRGPGLTPSGDDVVCGVALVLTAAGVVDTEVLAEALTARGHRTTSLSASLLARAARGYAVPPLVALIDDLLDPRERLSAERVAAVHAIGHSSGRDLCAGVAGALDHLSTRRPSPPSHHHSIPHHRRER